MINELLIKPITKSFARVLGFRIKDLVRNYPFEYGVNIKNIGDTTFNGGKIINILLRSTQKTDDSKLKCLKTFSIKHLKPQESVSIWFDKATLRIDGAYWLNVELIPNDIENKIYTYRWDTLNNKPELKSEGNWQNYIFIESEAIEHHRTTNIILGFLSLVLILEIIFGIRNLLENIIELFIDLFI